MEFKTAQLTDWKQKINWLLSGFSQWAGWFFLYSLPSPSSPSFTADVNQRERKWLFSIDNVDIWRKNKGWGSERCTENKTKSLPINSFLSLPNASLVWEWMELAVTFIKPEIPSFNKSSYRTGWTHKSLCMCVTEVMKCQKRTQRI